MRRITGFGAVLGTAVAIGLVTSLAQGAGAADEVLTSGLSRYRADARHGAGILQGLPGIRHRRSLGRIQISPAQLQNQPQRQNQGADRPRGLRADPMPILRVFPHGGCQGQWRHRRGD